MMMLHFERFQSLFDVITELEKNEEEGKWSNPRDLAVLYYITGKTNLAVERLEKVYDESELDSQKEYIKKLANQLGMTLSNRV